MLRRSSLVVVSLLALATSAAADPAEPSAPSPPYRRTDTLLLTTLALGFMHHLDHFASEGHPDFPFGAHSIPLTASLSVYPLYVGGYFLDLGPNYWMALDGVVLSLVVFAHHFDKHDPLSEHYNKWGDPGSPPDQVGPEHENLFGTRSRLLGVASVTVALALEVSIAAHLLSSVLDGRSEGFTWKRRRPVAAGTDLAITPCARDLCVGIAGRW